MYSFSRKIENLDMHSALFLDEILLLILSHCYPRSFTVSGSPADPIALATTCHAFKEPALDMLWAELNNPTALVRCLPQVCCSKDSGSSGRVKSLLQFCKSCI